MESIYYEVLVQRYFNECILGSEWMKLLRVNYRKKFLVEKKN